MVWGQLRKELRGARESPVARVHKCSNEWFIFGSYHVPNVPGCSMMAMGIIQTQSLDHAVDGQDQRIQTSKHVR
jgi:hypothetical protein